MNEIIEYSSYNQEWIDGKCDKYDYLVSVFCGSTTGVIDIFAVNILGHSIIGDFTDAKTDEMVKKFASFTGWKPREGNQDNVVSAIGFLERKFKINYDMKNSTDVDNKFQMGTKNHHFKSLGHSPDLIGLFFSILDQFTGKASFFSDGELIRIKSSKQDLGLYGNNFIAKIFCGFCNWLGHLMSDIAGSSGRKNRGSGIPAPFMGLFQLCDFGEFREDKNLQTLATVMTEVFQKGYDVRFFAATAVPVIINDLLISVFWVVRRHYQRKIDWKECIPNKKHSDLRMMKIVGFTTLCIFDAGSAAFNSGGNAVAFMIRMNYFAWLRLITLVFKELKIRYGHEVMATFERFMETALPYEQKLISDFNVRIEKLNTKMEKQFDDYISMLNGEYKRFHNTLEIVYDETWYSIDERSINSIMLAIECGVDTPFTSTEDLDMYFNE